MTVFANAIDKLISSLLIFSFSLIPSASNQLTNPPISQTSILFAGDIMLGRSVMGEAIDRNDYLYPFRNVQSFLKDADITFINLENAIIKNCPRQGKGSFSFCTLPEIAQGLKESGIDIVTLANNHSKNYGLDGFEETKKHLNNLGIRSVGYGNLEVIERNGIKFGFLGFDLVSNKFTSKDQELIANSDKLVDVLIVSPHWGEEYQEVANRLQVTVARQMIDNGADVIIGHHPHWVQNYEEYQGKPIYYSLGNFIFDQMWSEETKKGMLVKLTYKNNNLIKKEEFKTYTSKIGQPEILQLE